MDPESLSSSPNCRATDMNCDSNCCTMPANATSNSWQYTHYLLLAHKHESSTTSIQTSFYYCLERELTFLTSGLPSPAILTRFIATPWSIVLACSLRPVELLINVPSANTAAARTCSVHIPLLLQSTHTYIRAIPSVSTAQCKKQAH